jgi:hypothetical protein
VFYNCTSLTSIVLPQAFSTELNRLGLTQQNLSAYYIGTDGLVRLNGNLHTGSVAGKYIINGVITTLDFGGNGFWDNNIYKNGTFASGFNISGHQNSQINGVYILQTGNTPLVDIYNSNPVPQDTYFYKHLNNENQIKLVYGDWYHFIITDNTSPREPYSKSNSFYPLPSSPTCYIDYVYYNLNNQIWTSGVHATCYNY